MQQATRVDGCEASADQTLARTQIAAMKGGQQQEIRTQSSGSFRACLQLQQPCWHSRAAEGKHTPGAAAAAVVPPSAAAP